MAGAVDRSSVPSKIKRSFEASADFRLVAPLNYGADPLAEHLIVAKNAQGGYCGCGIEGRTFIGHANQVFHRHVISQQRHGLEDHGPRGG